MKRLIILLILSIIAFPVFSDDVSEALEESNKLLAAASEKITELEEENKRLHAIIDNDDKAARIEQLEKDVEARDKLLAEANDALESSNDVLGTAYDRIAADQLEIKDLRSSISNLINAGTELHTPLINFLIGYGYPHHVSFDVAVNFPFLPFLGVYGGAGFFFEQELVYARVGAKINIK